MHASFFCSPLVTSFPALPACLPACLPAWQLLRTYGGTYIFVQCWRCDVMRKFRFLSCSVGTRSQHKIRRYASELRASDPIGRSVGDVGQPPHVGRLRIPIENAP